MFTNKIKKLVVELIIYAVVVVFSAVSLIQVTKYNPKTTSHYYINGTLKYAMLSVPVPIDAKMEGQSVDYKVTCTMHKNFLECKETN